MIQLLDNVQLLLKNKEINYIEIKHEKGSGMALVIIHLLCCWQCLCLINNYGFTGPP